MRKYKVWLNQLFSLHIQYFTMNSFVNGVWNMDPEYLDLMAYLIVQFAINLKIELINNLFKDGVKERLVGH